MNAPFHAGERALQERAGMADRMGEVGPRVIRDAMPDQHRELFEKLPTIFVGSLDADGWPCASILVGPPGFVSTPDARTLHISARPVVGDRFAEALQPQRPVGLLGIEPHTRRRNRANGTLVSVSPVGLTVAVEQSYGNCPKYIVRRELRWSTVRAAADVTSEGALISAEAERLVASADTFFVASAAVHARAGGEADGVDVSHRGGPAGFVAAAHEGGVTTLEVADYTGNFMFNTLGNLLVRPTAGLLFIDWEQGHLLQLRVHATIAWTDPTESGTGRSLSFRVHDGRLIHGALPRLSDALSVLDPKSQA